MRVLQVLLIRAKHALAVIRFGLLTLRYAGLKVALRKLGHQFYGRTVFLHYVSDMRAVGTSARTLRFPCYTIRASEEDVKEFFDQVHHESNEGKYQMLVRKWYHERGLGTPYVQKTNDTTEVCSIVWVVTAQDLEKSGFGDRFPKLQEDEYVVENAYTLERFRGKGVQRSTTMPEIMLNMGFKRVKGIIAEDNIPMLRFRGQIPGVEIFEKVLERHFLFRVSHKTLERHDPPIPFPVPDGK